MERDPGWQYHAGGAIGRPDGGRHDPRAGDDIAHSRTAHSHPDGPTAGRLTAHTPASRACSNRSGGTDPATGRRTTPPTTASNPRETGYPTDTTTTTGGETAAATASQNHS